MSVCSLRRCFAVCVLLTLGSVSGGAAAERWIIPASAHANGQNGAKFRTDVTVVNPGATIASFTITFLPADADNSTLPAPVTVQVQPASQMELDDLVDTLFHKAGGGSLLVESNRADLIVASRTYNELPDRTYGMFLAGLPVEGALPVGETGHLVFLAKSDVYRTNVGFAATTATPGTAHVTLYDGDDHVIGTVSRDVKGYGQTQINDVFAAAGASATTVARAEITATVPLFCYATVIDNRTGDPFPLIALRIADAAKELVLTAAAHAPGANSSNFRSDLRVFNPEDAAGTLTLAFYPRGATTTSPQTKVVPLAAHQLLAIDDLLVTAFNQTSAAGAVKLTSDRALFGMSRTYNLAPDGSTSGQELPAVPLAAYVGAGDIARLPGISSRSARTNLIFFNPGTVDVPVTLELKGVSTTTAERETLASTTTTLPPLSMTQIDGATGVLGVPAGSTGYLEASTTAQGQTYWIIATVIDAGSNDPLHVAPTIQRATPPQECATLAFPRPDVTYSYSRSGATTATYTHVFPTSTLTTGSVHEIISSGSVTIDTTTTSTFHITDDLAYIEREVVSAILIPGFPAVTTTTTLDPAKINGPAFRFCGGRTWTSPPVTSTTTGSGSPVVVPVQQHTGKVLGVHESVTVPGGTFDTVHYMKTYADGTVEETWSSIAEGVPIKGTSTKGSKVTTDVLTSIK